MNNLKDKSQQREKQVLKFIKINGLDHVRKCLKIYKFNSICMNLVSIFDCQELFPPVALLYLLEILKQRIYNFKMSSQVDCSNNLSQNRFIAKHNKSTNALANIKQFFIQGKVFSFKKNQVQTTQGISIFLLISLTIIHTVTIESNISSDSDETLFQNILKLIQNQDSVYYLLFCLQIIVKFLLILSISVEVILKLQLLGLSWITKRVIQHSILIVQFDLILTAFTTVISWKQNLALLIISSLLSIFQAIYLQNYSVRSDPLYISSVFHYLIFQILKMAILFGNIVFLALGMQSGFYFFHGFVGALHFGWYFKKGHRLFIHIDVRTLFLIINTLFFTIDVMFLEKLVIGNPVISESQIFKALLIFSVLFFTLQNSSSCLIDLYDLSVKKISSAKTIDFLFKQMLEMGESDKEIISQLIGIIKMYQEFQCDDFLNSREQIYDPFLKTNVRREDVFTQKQTAILFLMLQIYQKSCDSKDRRAQNYVDFCEFICNQHSDLYLALKCLNQARLYSLSLLQRVRISALQNFIKDKNNKLVDSLYNSALKIQSIIKAQDCFSLIKLAIMQYVLRSISAWKSIGDRKISQAQLRVTLHQNFVILRQLEEMWKQIGQLLSINKAWQAIYMYYQLIIRNERIKQKDLEYLGRKAQDKQLTQNSIIYFDSKFVKKEELMNPAIIFQISSVYITAVLQGENLIISRVNNRFSQLSGYSERQITGSRIELLMTEELASIHSQKFCLWLKEGHISNQESYKIRFTQFVGKEGIIFPVVKYFKVFLDPESGLEFICLLKLNHKLEMELGRLSSEQNDVGDLKQNSKRLRQSFIADKVQIYECFQLKFNIFLKEEAFLPIKTFKQIQQFGVLSRIFIFIILASTIVLSEVISSDSVDLNCYGNQFVTIMSLYRSPFVLATTYMKKTLNIGKMIDANSYIQTITNELLDLAASKPSKLTLFDGSLNPDATYYPYYNYSFLTDGGLSSIDLFNTIVSTISSLNTSLVDSTSHEYQQFNSYLMPSYDTMMNSIKYRIHETFQKILRRSVNTQLYFVLSQTIVFIIMMVLLVFLIKKFAKKMEKILQTILNFVPNQAEDVRQYWVKVDRSFNSIFLPIYSQTNSSKKSLSITSQAEKEQTAYNQLTQKKEKGKKWKGYQIILQILTGLALIGVILPTVYTQIYMVEAFYQLESFESAGFSFLKYFPSGSLVSYGCTERYYSRYYPTEIDFNSQRYADSIIATRKFGYNYNYIGDAEDHESAFYAKQKNYFFGNPCEYNPSILQSVNLTTQICNRICNRTFQQGISSFLRYSYDAGSKCINDQIQLTPDELDEFTIGTIIQTIYIFDAIRIWTKEFTQNVQNVQNENLNTSIIVIIVTVIVHAIVKQLWIIRRLKDQYDFIKKVYMNMVPETILIKEKIVLQKLKLEGIVKI